MFADTVRQTQRSPDAQITLVHRLTARSETGSSGSGRRGRRRNSSGGFTPGPTWTAASVVHVRVRYGAAAWRRRRRRSDHALLRPVIAEFARLPQGGDVDEQLRACQFTARTSGTKLRLHHAAHFVASQLGCVCRGGLTKHPISSSGK